MDRTFGNNGNTLSREEQERLYSGNSLFSGHGAGAAKEKPASVYSGEMPKAPAAEASASLFAGEKTSGTSAGSTGSESMFAPKTEASAVGSAGSESMFAPKTEAPAAGSTGSESMFAPKTEAPAAESLSSGPASGSSSFTETKQSFDHSLFMPPEDKPADAKPQETEPAPAHRPASYVSGQRAGQLTEYVGQPAESAASETYTEPEKPVTESVPAEAVKPAEPVHNRPAEKPETTPAAAVVPPVFRAPDAAAESDETGETASVSAPVTASGEAEPEALTKEEVRLACEQIHSIVDNVETAIIGKRTVVELVLMTMLARGHVLLEDVPGVGKTSLVSCIARSVDCDFKRIQFTPDLMPSDITGFSIYNQKSGEFEFRPGAAMSNIVLADEINRASAKTQSAMLEIMEEKQVTVDSQTFEMEEPFFVMATQNPVESFGTYPLPEAQIDRFMVKLAIGYPKVEEEQRIVHGGREAKRKLGAVVSREDILRLREMADRVWVDPQVERYIVEIVAATRANAKIVLGSSPRGSIALNNAAKVYALFQNRGYVIPDDVKYLAPHILAHRLILSHEAKNEQTDPKALISEIVSSIVAPR